MKYTVEKLVRDNNFSCVDMPGFPDELLPPSNVRLVSERLPEDDKELSKLLMEKLNEELLELRNNLQDPSEYGDVIEVLLAIADHNKVGRDEISRIQSLKNHFKGTFTKGLIQTIEYNTDG